MKKLFFLIFLLAIVSVTSSEAQRKAGRNGGAFLEIGVGAREIALGSATTALSNDANQHFWNPAGTALTSDRTFSAAFSYNQWIADLNHAAAAVGFNAIGGTITVGAQSLSVKDIPANRQNGYSDPILQGLVTDNETSATYNYQDVAIGVTYAKYVLDRLSLGGTFNVINESIDGQSAGAIAFNFGSIYDVGVYGWKLAARINNLGSNLSFEFQDNPLPLTFAIGSTINPIDQDNVRVMVALDATKAMDSQQAVFGGGEVSLYDILFLRGGYKFNYTGASDAGTSTRPSINTTIEGFSAGAGIQYDMSGMKVAVDYSYTDMDLLDAVNRITLKVGK
ncbi:MAG: PorV/PorQ family protein [Rhodothermales bacterium]